ncbi:MAG TPA: nucleoside hydrolase [Anaerolineales bacterium]|jgi:inosine-uridine nucleoside N-ribohydrolase|nr:nucleoside hydrolase [Anaerolineales bacterium]
MHKIHLDTDLGGDIDDLCALAMLLRWEGVELTGITTVAEAHGRRAGYARYVLGLEGKSDIPVAAGADVSGGFYRYPELGYPDEQRYWPEPIVPSPNILNEALALLKQSIEQSATIIAIGPFTNLFLLDLKYPGVLTQANLFLMGGYVFPIRTGFPQWGNNMDWNIQVDVRSAKYVIDHSNPTLIPLSVTVETELRRAYLQELMEAGQLGQLIARQAEAFATDQQNETNYGESCKGLPEDIINFQHDALACAIALGWRDGVEMEEFPLLTEEQDGWLVERIDPSGKPVRVVTRINGQGFNEFWLRKIAKG